MTRLYPRLACGTELESGGGRGGGGGFLPTLSPAPSPLSQTLSPLTPPYSHRLLIQCHSGTPYLVALKTPKSQVSDKYFAGRQAKIISANFLNKTFRNLDFDDFETSHAWT